MYMYILNIVLYICYCVHWYIMLIKCILYCNFIKYNIYHKPRLPIAIVLRLKGNESENIIKKIMRRVSITQKY